MVFLFRKKGETPPMNKDYSPVDLVERYSSQGMNESQMMLKLKEQGFDSSQINRAIKATLKRKVTEPSGPSISRHPVQRKERQMPKPPETPTMQFPRSSGVREPLPPVSRHPEENVTKNTTPRGTPPERITGAPQMARPQISVPQPLPREVQSPSQPTTFTYEQPEEFTLPTGSEITLEEVVEGIVADKWEEFEHRLVNFEKRDLQLQNQIEDARKRLEDLESRTRDKEEKLIGKFEDFGDSMTNIEGRIGSMERVFKEFIPQLTQNIRTMSNIIEKTKEK